jgi:TonB family protein
MLIEAAARSLALGLVVWAALVLARARNPYLLKTVWSAVLLASVCMPVLMRAHVAPVVHAPEYVLTLLGTGGADGQPRLVSVWSAASACYALVALTLLWRYGSNWFRMARIRREAGVLRRDWTTGLDVRVSQQLSSPATFGSTILLPQDFTHWSEPKLQAVMAHERSHVSHRDCYLLWLARLHTSVFWFNPLAWWMQRRLALLTETISDEAAAEAIGDRPEYAQILLDFAQRQPASPVATAIARPAISARIDRILSGVGLSVPKRSHRLAVIAVLVPMVGAAAVPMQGSAPDVSNQNATTPNSGPDPLAPRITSWGGLAELQKYYPPEAKRQHVEGIVAITVTLDGDSRPTDTQIVSEDPPDMGFGDAAAALAQTMQYSNPTGQPVQFTFKVKFALEGDRRDAPAAQSPPDAPSQ